MKRWLYGMRPAGQAWEKDYSQKLEEDGFAKGKAAATVFMNPKTQVRLVVHGDDFTFLGPEKELDIMEEKMGEWYDIKVRGRLGDGPKCVQKMTILNRELEWKENYLTYEADPRHAKHIMSEAGIQRNSKIVDYPALKEENVEIEEERQLMQKEEATSFRRTCARANYLAQDRPDVQQAVGMLCREMSSPTNVSTKRLKKLSRYLRGAERTEIRYVDAEESDVKYLDVYVDSDWAGDKVTRRSTSGGVLAWGGAYLKSWSKRQSCVATSSGEAELYAMAKGAAEALGMKAVLEDLGWTVHIRIWTDSSAAKSIASRTGLGKTRHIEVQYLWIQDFVRKPFIHVKKIPGDDNIADLMTKPKGFEDYNRLLNQINVFVVRPCARPGLAEGGC